MFGFLKKKFGKSDEAAKAAESAAEDQHVPEPADAGGDAAVAGPASPPVEAEPASMDAADRAAPAEAEALHAVAAEAPS